MRARVLIEFIKNKEPDWHCKCTGNDYNKDVIDHRWMTVDYKTSTNIYVDPSKLTERWLQFAFSYSNYINNEMVADRCPKCNSHPYRIIGAL